MNAIACINIVSIILAIIGIIIVLCQNVKQNSTNSKNCFYGDPPGMNRSKTTEELKTDSWASFKCNDTISTKDSDPDCKLDGHRGSTASALLRSIEFDPNLLI